MINIKPWADVSIREYYIYNIKLSITAGVYIEKLFLRLCYRTILTKFNHQLYYKDL